MTSMMFMVDIRSSNLFCAASMLQFSIVSIYLPVSCTYTQDLSIAYLSDRTPFYKASFKM